MPERHFAVILAGGKGERFWPLSTSRRPKQLLSLVGNQPLLTQAVERLRGLIPPERIFVVTNHELVSAVCEAVPQLPREHVVGEPFGRDTAAAVALGAALVKARDPDGVFCVLTADHVIGNVDVFQLTLKQSLQLATEEEVLVTIGIQPTSPSTGYGYVEAGERLRDQEGLVFFQANRFVEKPDRATAEKYVQAGRFYWNSGMFIWSVHALESALRTYCPALAEALERITGAVGTPAFHGVLGKQYEGLDKISIDYALMERAGNIVMAQGTFDWDDVGSWTALANHFDADANANLFIGQAEAFDAESNIVVSQDHLTALVGVQELVVVQAPGVTLVCARGRVQDVKSMVERLRASGRYDEEL